MCCIALRARDIDPASAGWTFDATTHQIKRAGSLAGTGIADAGGDAYKLNLPRSYDGDMCVVAEGRSDSSALVLVPCSAALPAASEWATETIEGMTTVTLLNASWGAGGWSWVSERDTNVGEPVWLYSIDAGAVSYCKTKHNCAFTFNQTTGQFINPAQHCVAAKAGGPPPSPSGSNLPTCAVGSSVASMQFCNESLSFEERSAALVANLSLGEKALVWTVRGMRTGISRLNIKGFNWDSTCIHGMV